jgi:hypothetical protein
MTFKNLVLFCIVATAFTSCKPDYGSLTGNVYWKYNNYVGNKPDAGSEVSLFPYKKNSKAIETKADVQGNFKFDKVETGEYLLIVSSENTTSSPEEAFNELRFSSEYFKDVFDFDLSKVAPEKQKEFLLRDSLLRDYQINSTKDYTSDKFLSQMDVEKKKQDTIRNIVKAINEAIPSDFKSKLGVNVIVGHKVKIKKIKIEKDKAATEVIDFGITYF